MNLIVYNWFKEFLKGLFWQISERLLRVILFLLPMGLYLMLLQFRSKASKVSSLTAFTNDKSIWQHVFPGFILVAIDPDMFRNMVRNQNEALQAWVQRNRYTLCFLLAFIMVIYIILKEILG